MTFHPEILSENQLALLPFFERIPPHFILYGGTALALRFGHRYSVDFEFFSSRPFSPNDLLDQLPFPATPSQTAENTLSVISDQGVKVSFFGALPFKKVAPDESFHALRIASPLDIFAAKLRCVYARSEPKDYMDIDALIRCGCSLPQGVAAAKAVYGSRFNEILPLKALTYYEEPEMKGIPDEVKQRLISAVASFSPLLVLPPTCSDDISAKVD
jgi:hypothetical protein